MDVQLGKWGKLSGQPPKSLAIAFEFVTNWAGEENTAKICRLCAAAIGVYLDHLQKLPRYRATKETPSEYGYRCLEKMLAAGIPPKIIYEQGALLLAKMSTLIPQDEEVIEAENFTASDQGED
tara:strand:- start:1069 stop:1437 length:369 start_codon:yes stop_codon:yes gene_type:complete